MGAAQHLLRLAVRRPLSPRGRRTEGGRQRRERDAAGTPGCAIRAFANTCSDRGHELRPAVRLRGAAPSSAPTTPGPTLGRKPAQRTGFRRCRRLRRRGVRSQRAAAGRRHGWLFVDAGGRDVDFGRHVAGLATSWLPTGPRDLTVVARHSYELATNWKVIAENYLECYHCQSIHPERSRGSARPPAGRTWTDGAWMGAMSIVDGAETMSLTAEGGDDRGCWSTSSAPSCTRRPSGLPPGT